MSDLYIKKPIIIEAVKWTGGNSREMFDFLESSKDKTNGFHRRKLLSRF